MQRTLSRIHKARSGLATVLGMLIFIGVIFTCVIPLFLYVNEVNSLYDQTAYETSNFDLERTQEKCDAFAYPLNSVSDYLNIYIKNKCALDVKIVRVWVNNVYYEFDNATAPAMDHCNIQNLNVSQLKIPNTRFIIKVTSTRGKSYSSITNPLFWNGTCWTGGMGFYVQVVIESARQGQQKYHVEVTGPEGFIEVGDIVKGPQENSVFLAIQVPNEGRYYITAENINHPPPLDPTPAFVDIDFETTPEGWSYCYETQ